MMEKKLSRNQFYCIKKDRKPYPYDDFYKSILQCKMCGGTNKNIILVEVNESDCIKDETYVGFVHLDKEDQSSYDTIGLIYPTFFMVDMCFPYGVKSAIELGRGKIINLKIKELTMENV